MNADPVPAYALASALYWRRRFAGLYSAAELAAIRALPEENGDAIPDLTQKCLTCRRRSANSFRGCCDVCYRRHSARIARRIVTWGELERCGMARPRNGNAAPRPETKE